MVLLNFWRISLTKLRGFRRLRSNLGPWQKSSRLKSRIIWRLPEIPKCLVPNGHRFHPNEVRWKFLSCFARFGHLHLSNLLTRYSKMFENYEPFLFLSCLTDWIFPIFNDFLNFQQGWAGDMFRTSCQNRKVLQFWMWMSALLALLSQFF